MSGNMFNSELVRPINKHQLETIVSDLEIKLANHQMFSDPPVRNRTLGSSSMAIDGTLGRKDLMGDIDIAVSYSSGDVTMDLATMESIIKAAFPTMEVASRQSLKIVSLLYKLSLDHEVQIDFILGDLEIIKFMFTSPDPNHNTDFKKGFYRNFYLSALTQSLRFTIFDGSDPIAFAGPKLDRHKGITFEYRHHPLKKNGIGRTKQIKQIDKHEFNRLYGTTIELPTKILDDPEDIIRYFFPKSKMTVDDYDTVESLRMAISENYSLDEQDKIEKRFQEILESSK